MSFVHLAKKNYIFFQLRAEAIMSLHILNIKTNGFYATC